MHYALQGKPLIKNLDDQTPELSYSLGLAWIKLYKEITMLSKSPENINNKDTTPIWKINGSSSKTCASLIRNQI